MRSGVLILLCSIAICGCLDNANGSRPYAIAWNKNDAKGVDLGHWLKPELAGLKSTDRVLLALIGQCESCSAEKYKPGMEISGKYSRVVLVYQDKPEDLRRSNKSRNDGVYRTIADPGDRFGTAVALQMAPRLYELDSQGIVVRAQVFDRVEDGMLK